MVYMGIFEQIFDKICLFQFLSSYFTCCSISYCVRNEFYNLLTRKLICSGLPDLLCTWNTGYNYTYCNNQTHFIFLVGTLLNLVMYTIICEKKAMIANNNNIRTIENIASQLYFQNVFSKGSINSNRLLILHNEH